MNTADGAPPAKFTLTHGIMGAVLLWGGYLAIGAMRAPGNHGLWRGLIVFGCTLAFLGLWAIALSYRRATVASEERHRPA